MGTARTITPVTVALPFLSTVTYATSTAQPIGLSRDRATVFGAPNPYHDTGTILYGSTDDGSTWTSIHTFAEPVVGIRETGDGEAIVITQDLASSPGYVYKSSGWTASRSAATWTKVLTSTGGYFRPFWGGGHASAFGDDALVAGTGKYGVITEYGAQTSSSTPDATKATHSYFTSDYGATWTAMLDMQTRYPGVFPTHWHSAAYDPWWDRIWLLYGDLQADGTSNADILYSDDHGSTWTAVPTPTTSVSYQMTSIKVLPEAIIMGADNQPGYIRLPRKGYRVMGALQTVLVEAASNSTAMVAMSLHQQPGGPIIGGWTASGATVAPGIVGSLDGGLSWSELWWDEGLRGSTGGGAVVVVGPTVNGRYVGNIAQGTTTDKVLRATLTTPPAGLYDGRVNLTGDGTTTVFNVAHGLASTPTQLYAGGMNIPTTDFTLTADATNLIFTFTVAPANAAIKRVIYRYGT